MGFAFFSEFTVSIGGSEGMANIPRLLLKDKIPRPESRFYSTHSQSLGTTLLYLMKTTTDCNINPNFTNVKR
jgi:hypothetical protein